MALVEKCDTEGDAVQRKKENVVTKSWPSKSLEKWRLSKSVAQRAMLCRARRKMYSTRLGLQISGKMALVEKCDIEGDAVQGKKENVVTKSWPSKSLEKWRLSKSVTQRAMLCNARRKKRSLFLCK
ncbi:hypothetical protein AVEN_103026-1 [Araneus ventricosus]|uniref:Uncharacterized protein n=1 Tax=Araneus ventricosus TaxID=182803 RepID=A0A4Y2B9B7_ARAVE|nr:hypothetical protein AVEN_103026-1 [Araneus ventricosus]